MTCQALAAALPDFFNWLLAAAVFGPFVVAIVTAMVYEHKFSRGIHWQRELDSKLFDTRRK